MQILTEEERERRRKKVAEAIGLCIMSGLPDDKNFRHLMERYVCGEITLNDIKRIAYLKAEEMVKEENNNGSGE